MSRPLRRRLALCWVLGATGVLLLLFTTATAHAEAGLGPAPPVSSLAVPSQPVPLPHAGKRVLYLATDEFLPTMVEISARFNAKIRSGASTLVHVDVQTIHPGWVDEKLYQEKLHDLLRARYVASTPDVIVSITSEQLDVALDLQRNLWPDVPIVFGVEDEQALPSLPSRGEMTGRFAQMDYERTVELALELLPNTRRIVAVNGVGSFDIRALPALEKALATPRAGVEILRWNGLEIEELERRAAALPADTILLVGNYRADLTGRRYVLMDIVKRLHEVSPAPIFSVHKNLFGNGLTGGRLVDYGNCGEGIAEITLRVLAGERASTIPVAPCRPGPVAVDARELDRFHIPDSRLSTDTEIHFREPTLWQQYRAYVVGSIGLTVLQALLIAGLLVERRWRQLAQAALAERLRFEKLLASVSADFADLPVEKVGAQIEIALERFGMALGVGRACLWKLDDSGLTCMQAWHSESAGPPPLRYSSSDFPLSMTRLRRGEPLLLRYEREESNSSGFMDAPLPPDTGTASHTFALPIALDAGGTVLLTFMHPHTRRWEGEHLHGLHGMAEILGRALNRLAAKTLIQRSEALNRAILISLPGYLVILDAEGRVTRENDPGPDSARATSVPELVKQIGAHGNYLDTFRRTAERGDIHAARVVNLLEKVQAGELTEGFVEIHDPAGDTWFEVRARKLSWDEPAILVAHLDISGRKRAEIEARRVLSDLAHVGRVADMVELTVSIAHEINQPLAAIQNNAEAARRLLSRKAPDIQEAMAALDDIIADDRHAGEVIGRMRAMLKKGEVRWSTHDLNVIVREVERLLANDTLLRGVRADYELVDEPLLTLGDGVQLQQVVLNLVSNALQAVAEQPPEQRRIWVRTAKLDGGVELVVEDSGKGFADGVLEHIFDAFFTTKAEGMGLGLSISRSLVESHKGELIAARRPKGGARFRCVLRGPSQPG